MKKEITTYLIKKSLILSLLSTGIFIVGALLFIIIAPSKTHKPAIYLYSSTPQKVKIVLGEGIFYSNVVPNYYYGWRVETIKNGQIKDLQPQRTNCTKLPKGFGFEYAKQACESNSYPYIYWDGASFVSQIPNSDKGWIIEKTQAKNFLETKAKEIAFNKSEKTEFVRYWTDKINDIKTDYVKIYFLQNEQVDKLYPLKIEPRPNYSNRIQIVVTPILTNIKIEPQQIKPIKRKGFTLVEWGGIVR